MRNRFNKCWISVDRDENIIHIMGEYRKLIVKRGKAQK